MKPAILLPLLAGLSTCAWATHSSAEPAPKAEGSPSSDVEKARALFNQARQLVGQALYDQACPLFEESLELEPRLSTQFNLADCWERLERTASAHALFLEVAEATQKAGDLEREKIARRRAEMLEPRLCALEVNVAKPAPEQTVRLGQKALVADHWGTAVPVDPGPVEVQVEAPGRKPWSSKVDVSSCPTLVTVEVPELEPVVKEALLPVIQKPVAPPPSEPRKSTPQEQPEPERPSLVLPLALAGVGTAAIVGGVIFSERYKQKNYDAKEICRNGTNCTNAEIARHGRLVDDAKSARTWSYVGFGVGAAALTSAAIVYFTGQASTSSEQSWSAAPLVVDEGKGWGASFSGSF